MNELESEYSSSNDDNMKFKEAIDPEMFLHMNTENTNSKTDIKEAVKKNNYSNLKVTPEFQSYVAKHLIKILDQQIEECPMKLFYQTYNDSGGIRLFSDSKKLLKDKRSYEMNDNIIKKKKRKSEEKHRAIKLDKDSESDTELLKAARSVAVSPEWVLNKKGVYSWYKSKGEEIKLKKNKDGVYEVLE